jgi:glutaredoxin
MIKPMMTLFPLSTQRRALAVVMAPLMALLACSYSSSAWALYKVVGPDGKVTYTDQAPVNQRGQTLHVASGGVSTSNLPYELAQVVVRYPVIFYAFKGCTPCDQGRTYLKQRGIPFTEKSADTNADLKALEQVTGTKQMPLLRIGQQQINGYSSANWGSYLDAAGYPKTSALPKDYRWPEASPLVSIATPTDSSITPDNNPAPQAKPRYPTAPGNATGIRF